MCRHRGKHAARSSRLLTTHGRGCARCRRGDKRNALGGRERYKARYQQLPGPLLLFPYARHRNITQYPQRSCPSSRVIAMSTSYYQYQPQPTGSLPLNVTGKGAQQTFTSRHVRNSSNYSQLSASPPERPESVSTSGAGLYSAASSSYAGSEYEASTSGATSVDLLDYMNDRLSQAYNPLPMDQSLAKQAQM